MSNAPSSAPPTGAGPRSGDMKADARREFDRWSATYDRSWINEFVFRPSMRACQEEIYRWLDRRSAQRFDLLDVGCGTASLLVTLAGAAEAGRLAGLDYSPSMVAHAQRKLAGLGLAERISVSEGDAEHPPFAPGSFDIVTCCNSFHHYPHQEAVIRQFASLLRPGGMLVLIDGFRDNVVGWVLFDVFVALAERNVHHAAWGDIRRWAEQAGFEQVVQRKINVLAPLLVTVAERGGRAQAAA